ncbi:VanZ family protein [Clostridium aestuarii]|uniref:VanZ family protein n=1 Tax=Clostridium aestuarii TaxID=338193 RepID=A0ABT4D3V1_9CLOT|nr:VanZ family protein [Clostridium aestuarii]MCY6485909.1 VanZ family protein [Clostridium aestuarii]
MKKKYLKLGLVVLWMIIIFMFSNQPADLSDENNKFVIYLLNHLGIDLSSLLGKWSDFLIRKAAHLTEYFILYVLLYNALNNEKLGKKTMITVLGIIFLYACSDEFHQSFVPGRGPAFRDVLIDTSGGLIAGIIIYIKNKIKINYGRRKIYE